MTLEIDLRNCSADERRERLFEALEGADVGDGFDIVSDRDIDTHLLRYQLQRGRALEWEYEHPDAEPRELRVTAGDPLDDGALGTIDVRDLKPQRRHEVLLEAFDDLGAGEGFVLVNDHDPKPLYHELRSMHGDVIDWEYENRGAGECRVEIVKTADSEFAAEDVVTRYDVREIPKPERHPTIHHRYGMIPEGETMELIAPHEPRPLRREFRQQYGDSFTWDVVESEPGRCRVHVTKGDSTEDDAIEVTGKLDVRELPPAERHERIFDAYDGLDVGSGFVLVNDHDPKPLYHQFEAEAGPEFRWEYRQRDAGEFKVLIGKAEAAVDGAAGETTEAPF
ncbi:DUF2249 domain-containing protein [Natronomonas sp. LN261]|jgi:uncharacterized protein (DUF2249 family)|uniref:DUF2249 domain-containing protein n=1 Tax=Natronomonas sp. LN261 TaxID=2750669 RepID=UPI0015EF6251|nr:DUF2249 domain-containing protein [Natronomonas sp. LN261]